MPITMFDSTDVSQIPKGAEAVAGYTAGRFVTYPKLVAGWPAKTHKLSIAVASRYDAECLDIERFDATNEVAAGWVKRQVARGVKKPVLYTSVSNVHALLSVIAREGIYRNDIRLWTAHYTHTAHLCGPACGFDMPTKADATQWTNKALDRTLDASLCSKTFFGPVARPAHRWDKRQLDRLKHHLHEIQDVGRLVGWTPALRATAAKLRHLIGGRR